MKVVYTTPNGRMRIEQDIAKGKDAFEFVARISELFEEKECGCCHSANIVPSVREHDSYKFYEYKCLDCTARFSFGQHKEGGTLFPKRWDKERSCNLPDNGWSIYQGDGQTGGNGSGNNSSGGGYDGQRPSTAGTGPPQNQRRPAQTEEPIPF